MGRPVGAVGPKVGAARGVSRLRGKVTKSSAIPPPTARFFLHRPTVVRCAPRLCSRRAS